MAKLRVGVRGWPERGNGTPGAESRRALIPAAINEDNEDNAELLRISISTALHIL
jgi:hypothetical protein